MINTTALLDGLKEVRKAYTNMLGFEMLQKIKRSNDITAKITFIVKGLSVGNQLMPNIILHLGLEETTLFVKLLTYDNKLIDTVSYNLEDFSTITQKMLFYNGTIILLERNKLTPCINMNNRDSKIAVVNLVNLVNTGQPSNRELYINNKDGVFVHVYESTPKVRKEIKLTIEEYMDTYKFNVHYKIKNKNKEYELTDKVIGSYNDLINNLNYMQRKLKRMQDNK